MYLAENVQVKRACSSVKIAQLRIAEGGDDQQHCVRTVGPRFQYLKFIHHEIFAQAGNPGAQRRLLQVG